MGGKHARRLTWLFALLLGVVAVIPIALIVGLAMRQVTENVALTPYVMILAALLLTLVAAQLMLQHWIVRPSLALLRHIQAGGQGAIDRIPALWQPWFDAVSDAFTSSRDFQARLAASEERLKTAAESLPDGLAIFDAEDRLAFHNSRYPDHLTDPLRTTMALGKSWPEWAREARVLGPIYHPDMGADYLDARIDDRGEPAVDREHKMSDGRWLRVRERRMTDGGRVLLTTDISEERRRKQEQMLLAAAVAQTGDSIEITTADYHIHYVNPAFSSLTGYGPDEAIGRTPAQLLRSTVHDPAFFDEIDRVTRGGRPWKGRIVSRHKDGRLIQQDATISPIHDETGRLTHFVAAKRDVTDKVNADAALRASEARFLGAAESIPDGLAILDADDRIVFYNSRHPELLPPALRDTLRIGVQFDEWIREGLAHGEIYHPQMGPDYAERRLASRGGDLSEREHRHADGRWVRIREGAMPDGGRVLLTTDITARREAEERLRASEARFLAAAESIPDGIAIFDAEDRFVFHNSRYPQHLTDNLRRGLRLGIRFEDWIRQALAQGPVYHPDMGPEFAASRLALRREERAEHEHRIIDGRWLRIRESRMADGGYVLLTTDVTERRRRERQLLLLAMAVDQVGDAVEITDAEDHFTYVNPAFTQITGYEPAEVIGHLPQEILSSGQHEPEFFADMRRQLAAGDTWQGLIVNRCKNGGLIHQNTTISPLRDSTGRVTHFIAVKRDVTEQQKAEAAIRESELRYRALVETQTEFVTRSTRDGKLLFVNEAYSRYHGVPRETMLSPAWNDWDFIAPEDRDRHLNEVAELTLDAPTRMFDLRTILPDGSQHWEQWVSTGIFDSTGALIEFQAVGRDVTKQKQAELALKESEARYRALVETQTEFVLRQLPNGQLTFVNEAYCRYVGLPREELLSDRFNAFSLMAPEYRPIFEEHLQRLTPERPTKAMETRAILSDGSERWERWVDTGIFDRDGKLVELQSTGRDATEQKRAELALMESEARFRAVVEGQSEFILRLRPDGTLTFVNDAYCRYRGLDREVLLGGFNDVYHYPPEQQATIHAAWAGLTPDFPSVTYELKKPCADGGACWEEWTDTAIFAPNGRVIEYQAIGRDVSERKRAEQALTESEARFRMIAEGVPLPIAITALDNPRVLFVNPKGREVFGVEPGAQGPELVQQIWADPDLREQLAKHIAKGRMIEQREVRMRRRDGSSFDALLSARPIHYEGERAVLGVITDITDRRRMEEALRESQARLAALMDNAPLVLHLKDREGRYILANPECAKIFGCDPAQLIGRTAYDVFPHDEAAVIDQHHRAVLETGRTLFHEEYQASLDAYKWSIVIRFPIFDAHGKVSIVGGFALDITERKRAEAALKASEARLAAFMENAPVGMYLKDREGRYLVANPEMANVFGRPVEEIIGSTPEELLAEGEAPGIRAFDREVWEQGLPTVHEEHFPDHASYAWSMVIRFPIRDETGQVAQIGGFDVDITRPKLAEAEVKASEQRFRTIAEIHPTPMVITRLDDREVLFANRAYFAAFGLTPDELAEFDRDALYGQASDREAIYAAIDAGMAIESREINMRTVAGEPFPAMLTARGITYEGSRCCVMSFLDLTALKRAEAALRASEQRFRSIAEAHPMPLVIVRLSDGRLCFANEPFVSLFQLEGKALDQLTPEAFYADPAERRHFLETMRDQGAVNGLEQILRRLDGTTFFAATTSQRIEYEGDEAFVTSVVDLTERKAAEAEIRRQREALHQNEKLTALGSLLAGVAHELNNPLSVVVGYSSMLKELAQDDATRQRAERVHAAAERCARIVKTFLAMARSRPPKRGPVAINEVIEDALDLAGYGLRTADVEITREFDAELPQIWGDSDQLHQVFTNLIVNAQQALLQAAPPRRLRLRTMRHGDELQIEIEDNGPGIDDDVQTRIFEPFFTTKPQGVGTGVGLSVCHGIVAAHQGRIIVASRLGHGTRFVVTLPIRSDMLAAGERSAPALASPKTTGRVLVVDDEKEIGELVAEHLRRDGLIVEVVTSGRAALGRLESRTFDLVVSDLRMPDLDGPALLEVLRQRHPQLARRLVLITGDALRAEVNTVIQEANLPVFEKPLDLMALRDQVRRLMVAA
ncbi:MAG: PAS domain S-box protein [Geminicoccaceae bacterium]